MVTPAQEPPATTTGAQFIRSLAEAERGLGAGQLEAGHRAALARWPDEPLVLLANGNDAHARGELNAAIGHYRKLLAVDPVNVAGRNNLASALLDAGCPALALAEAQQAVGSLSPGDPLEAAVRETLEAAKAAASGNSTARCTAVPL